MGSALLQQGCAVIINIQTTKDQKEDLPSEKISAASTPPPPMIYEIIMGEAVEMEAKNLTHSSSNGFPSGDSGKESTCQCRRHKRRWFNPWVRKIPWSRKWQPTPVFLPGKSHGQRSLAGPWGHKESDTTGQLSTHILKMCPNDEHGFVRLPISKFWSKKDQRSNHLKYPLVSKIAVCFTR